MGCSAANIIKLKPVVFFGSDYPTGSKAAQQPIFSMCGGGGGEDFLLPTYDMMMSVSMCIPKYVTALMC